MPTLHLTDLLGYLESIAPLENAAEWDSVGLLVEGRSTGIHRLLLTLDLTPAVAAEALRKKTDCIISYHPPIFGGLPDLCRKDPLTAALLDLVQAGISVYSPHTALDAAPDGLADWLAAAFEVSDVEPIEGSGRRLRLRQPLSLQETAARFQAYLGLPYLRIAIPPGTRRRIRTLALCPGAGASVLKDIEADAIFTGEIKHHDALKFQRQGTFVLVSEHSHTERPYLKVYRKRLRSILPKGVLVEISRQDREPLTLWGPDA
jgi:dinuclear metal center YbgI/SA1388 family protein